MTPTMMKQPTVALYARVSTTDQCCDLQLNECRSYCERRGWTIVAEYVDTGWSGSKKSRPQLDKLMAAAKRHMFDVVMTWKIDRFGRSVVNFVEALELLNSNGVRFVCVTQAIDTDNQNPSSRLLMQILAAVAEFEREMVRERVKAGMKAAIKRGVRCGRSRRIFDRDQVATMHLQGKTDRQIAAALGISKGTVYNVLQERLHAA